MNETAQAMETTTEEQERQQYVYEEACSIYCSCSDWAAFFRDVLGLRGIIRKCYPSREALVAFERTEVYAEIQQMLSRLRSRTVETIVPQEPTGVITVRLPKSVHETLKAEAYERRTSMNKLCISKLLQFIDNELVPSNA